MRPCECLGSVWSQRDRPGAAGVAPTVRATVAQFNAVTGCVLGSVLGAPGLAAARRAQRIEKWIWIAQVGAEGRAGAGPGNALPMRVRGGRSLRRAGGVPGGEGMAREGGGGLFTYRLQTEGPAGSGVTR